MALGRIRVPAAVVGVLAALFASCLHAWPRDATCLLKAYPDFVKDLPGPNQVRAHSGDVFVFDQSLPAGSHAWRLDHADLKAQLEQEYPKGPLSAPPPRDADPDRLRSQAFFERMYGQSLSEVEQHMTSVYWAPCRCRIAFSKRNGAAQALEKVGRQLALRPELAAYVGKPMGSLNWRAIAGTQRRSMHAYGVAVDFQLPGVLGHYWRWRGCQEGASCPYPAAVLADARLKSVVQIFEDNGFIWGGKWHHFDTVHYEFRPELVGSACATAS